MRKVKVWEACVLSVGLEPDSMEFEDERWREHKPRTGPHIESESFPSPEIEKDYKDLVEVLADNLLEGEHFDINEIGDINNPRGKKYYTVRLDEFVRWATLKVTWLNLPPELAALVLNNSNGNSANADDSQTSTDGKQKRAHQLDAIIKIAQEQCDNPNSASQVMNALRELSEKNPAPIPLVYKGYVVEDEAIKYRRLNQRAGDTNEIDCFTLKNLRDYLSRRKTT